MVDAKGDKVLEAGRKTPDQVLKQYGGKPQSKVDGEGDFTPARRVKKNEQTQSVARALASAPARLPSARLSVAARPA